MPMQLKCKIEGVNSLGSNSLELIYPGPYSRGLIFAQLLSGRKMSFFTFSICFETTDHRQFADIDFPKTSLFLAPGHLIKSAKGSGSEVELL